MLYPSCTPRPRVSRRTQKSSTLIINALCVCLFFCAVSGTALSQELERELNVPAQGEIVIKNQNGRVNVLTGDEEQKTITLKASSPGATVGESDVLTKATGNAVEVEVRQRAAERDRIDLTLRVPARLKLRVETKAGAVDVAGQLRDVSVTTDTGTIRVDVPLDSLSYNFVWTGSRPRFFSEVELGKVKEKSAGRYEINGRIGDKRAGKDARVKLSLTTERGLILFGVDPAMVPSDLRPRPLTEAARAIIRSGNVDMIEAIHKVAPKYVGEYTRTLPPPQGDAPALTNFPRTEKIANNNAGRTMRLNVNVTDTHGRAISNLKADDFNVTENGETRVVTDVEQTHTPFNLILLLDVSGSVEERLDFIRKAALDFLRTTSPQDRIAIISFRDDIQVISDFTSDRTLLAERVKNIEAGGSTALYDALAYTLVHTLKPLRGERTAIVILSDGDDNRSFIPFPTILEATIESGALIYPLYIPSGLIPTGSVPEASETLDPTRTRFLTLTSRAEEEGRKLAQVSGGIYYPITRLDELQRAYDDVVAQLRTSYTISYTSNATVAAGERHIRVRLARRNDAAIRLSPAVAKDEGGAVKNQK